MNIIDIIIIVALILGAITGFIRGFFKQTVMFVGIFIVVILSFILKNPLSLILYKNLPFFKFGGLTSLNILMYEILAFIICLVVFTLVLGIIIKLTGIIENILKATVILALPSKLLGMVVGVIQSIVILYVVLFILSLPVFKVPYINESQGANMILTKTPIVSAITNDAVKTFNEIYEFTTNDVDFRDVKNTNTKIVEIMLKNKVVTTENIKILSDSGKIEVSNINELITKYTEA
ncbi:MAG: CvpA family protein [Bacilli bacterium]|nr:CvpA family protein [Bacilli bacterium]